jgi:pilus assembly protein Flp/PilA
MIDFLRMWLALRSDRRGVTAIEYGLIAALIAAVIVTVLTAIGGDLTTVFTTIDTSLKAAGG